MKRTDMKFDAAALTALSKRVIKDKIAAGNALLIGDGDGVLFENYEGVFDAEKGGAVSSDTLFHLYSMTKIFTVVSALLIFERGLIGLDDPVCEYIPEYASLTVRDNKAVKNAENVMKIRDLFTMTSGLTYLTDKSAEEIAGFKERLKNSPGTVGFAKSLASLPLAFEPGERFEYGLSHDVLGAVTEVVSGKTLDKFFADEIFALSGMTDTFFYQCIPADRLPRLAKNTAYKDGRFINIPFLNRPVPALDRTDGKSILSGGSGLVGTAKDLAAFLTAMISGRILKPGTLRLMTTPALTEAQRRYYNREGADAATFGREHTFGLGVRVQDGISETRRGSIGEWGWSGALGTWFFVCPESNQWFLYLHQHSPAKHGEYVIPMRNAFYDRSDRI